MAKQSYLDELNEKERRAERLLQLKREAHKCSGCVWARWQENVVFCPFAWCFAKK